MREQMKKLEFEISLRLKDYKELKAEFEAKML
jgi:hypothetical protein